MKWRPMDTAPQDGTPVLLLIEGNAIQGYSRWSNYDERQEWQVVTMDSHGCGCCGRDNKEPTGWMPLPTV